MTTKEQVIKQILSDPLNVSPEDFEVLFDSRDDGKYKITFEELRSMIKRIFDINERTLLEQSNATTGILGYLNKKSSGFRLQRYNRKVKKKSFDRFDGKTKVIVAEGDSWFQFPFFVTDIIDWLQKRNPHYVIYSIAYGGDWITNIIYEGKYVEELSIHNPDAFLISGSGNDLVGSNRLAIMVDRHANCPKYSDINELPPSLNETDKQEIFSVQNWITKDFYSFLLTMKAQYRLMIDNLTSSKKLEHMKIITQAYDYAIPSYKKRWSWSYPHQWLINLFLGSGKWLVHPMRIKGVTDPETQRKIIKAFIFEMNEMLKEFGKKYPGVFHVDCRGIATGFEDWFDELHLKSHVFKKVAQAFEDVIEGRVTNGVVNVKERMADTGSK